MGADVDADFVHDLDGQGMNVLGGGHAGGVNVETVLGELFEDAFGDLAASGVAGAEDEDTGFGFVTLGGEAGAGEGIWQSHDPIADFIADAGVVGECFLGSGGGLGECGRIVEADVNDFGLAGKNGTSFVGVSADGDDVVEGDMGEGIDVLGGVLGDVDAGFGHGFGGEGIEDVGFDAGGPGVDDVGLEVAGPAFGHLGAAGVSGAEEEDF